MSTRPQHDHDREHSSSDYTTVTVTPRVLDELHDRRQRGDRLNDVVERALGLEDGRQ
jgi:hypothetical protein